MTAPLLFTVEAFVDHYVDQDEAPFPEELEVALGRVGRDQGPALLAALHAEGLLFKDAAQAHVGGAWNSSEYPDRLLPRATWRELFVFAGYTRNGAPAERPSESLTLYRGSVTERRADWSWTDKPEVAAGYAAGTLARRPAGLVWVAVVEPWRLLARNDGEDNRNEEEYVVDTQDLSIVALEAGSVAAPVASGGAEA